MIDVQQRKKKKAVCYFLCWPSAMWSCIPTGSELLCHIRNYDQTCLDDVNKTVAVTVTRPDPSRQVCRQEGHSVQYRYQIAGYIYIIFSALPVLHSFWVKNTLPLYVPDSRRPRNRAAFSGNCGQKFSAHPQLHVAFVSALPMYTVPLKNNCEREPAAGSQFTPVYGPRNQSAALFLCSSKLFTGPPRNRGLGPPICVAATLLVSAPALAPVTITASHV